MLPTDGKSHETQPPPEQTHPLPRRVPPENSITLHHHRLAREASLRASRGSAPADENNETNSLLRGSSGESHETRQSDAKKWFDQSNQNPTATFDNNVMDVDPPFFQKESDSSNEDKPYQYQQVAAAKPMTTLSSSADDYRSVIDDLTIEIQKLKEELKRYKQSGPDMLRKDKLFEIKIHGLPKKKKRELEATLRDFTASLHDSPHTSPSQRKKFSKHAHHDRMYSGSGSMSMSKHASSASGSHTRPVDSAYASMSVGANSSGTSLNRPHLHSNTADQKVENYLRDIPEGLYPKHMAMTEKEKKKLVVRRLEQIFTGKISGHGHRAKQLRPPGLPIATSGVGVGEVSSPQRTSTAQQPQQQHQAQTSQQQNLALEPSREARILLQEVQPGHMRGKNWSHGMGSTSNSNGDQTEFGGNGNGNGNGSGNGSGGGGGGGSSGLGTNQSPPMAPPPEQRPTRLRDLDPDRVQIPSENMEYIKHLGLLPAELIPASTVHLGESVSPDAEGWVYLNLLCSMAQLHIMNVTPSFVRSAVSDLSAKFQLSPDGQKIKWRGGTEGTKFSSDSSGDNSQRSPEVDDSENSKDGQRKRQKKDSSIGDGFRSGISGKNVSKFGPQISGSSDGFHYKPLFVRHHSSNEQSSMEEDTPSSFGPLEDSNGDSRWGQSGSAMSNRRKRRHDGAIIYYSGAPFCTDLSGDPGDISPATYMLSSEKERLSSGQGQVLTSNEILDQGTKVARPITCRSGSGSTLVHRPLSDLDLGLGTGPTPEVDALNAQTTTIDSEDDESDFDFDFPWCDGHQLIEVFPLEPCGIGGVLPEDHFMVVVTTRRPKHDAEFNKSPKEQRQMSEKAIDGISKRLATISTSSPRPLIPRFALQSESPGIKLEYLSGRIKRLAPVSLPPPAIFYPPFSADSWSEDYTNSDTEDSYGSSADLMIRRANLHKSNDYPDGVDLSGGDEDGSSPDDDEAGNGQMYQEADGIDHGLKDKNSLRSSGSTEAAQGTTREGSNSVSAGQIARIGGSSAATAGGIESGYSSSAEESSRSR